MLKYAKLKKTTNRLHHLAEHVFVMFRNKKKAFPKPNYSFKNRFENLPANCHRNKTRFLVFRRSVLKNFSKTTLLKLGIELKTRPLQCLIALLI